MWFFDSALGILGWYQTESKRVSWWHRPVWESAGFTFDGMRGLPKAPPQMHDLLVQEGATKR